MRLLLVLISLLALCMARPVPTLTGIWVLDTQKSQRVRVEVLTKPCAADGGVSHQWLTFHPAERLALVARP
jgi:hypothetical protein